MVRLPGAVRLGGARFGLIAFGVALGILIRTGGVGRGIREGRIRRGTWCGGLGRSGTGPVVPGHRRAGSRRRDLILADPVARSGAAAGQGARSCPASRQVAR